MPEALRAVAATWKAEGGIPQVDCSSQNAEKQVGAHTEHIEIEDFRRFLAQCPIDYDIMLSIKDKEASALEAVEAARAVGRLKAMKAEQASCTHSREIREKDGLIASVKPGYAIKELRKN